MVGAIVNSYAYDPFGSSLGKTETVANPFEFAGEFGVMDAGNGLDFMRNRYYLPEAGAFTSVDPLLIPGQGSYRFANNSPVQFIDPAGLSAIDNVENFLWTVGCSVFGPISGTLCSVGTSTPPNLPAAAQAINCGVAGPMAKQLRAIGDEPAGCAKAPPANATPLLVHPAIRAEAAVLAQPPLAILIRRSGQEVSARRGSSPQATSSGVARIDFEKRPHGDGPSPARRDHRPARRQPRLVHVLALTEVGFGDNLIIIPAGSQNFQTTVAMTYNGKTFDVDIELGLDAGTGRVYAHFLSIDPSTQLPPDVLTGFLPPEDGTNRGEGYFSYTILPKAELPTGTPIRNVALVTFDSNFPAIATDQIDEHDPSKGTDPAKMAHITIDSLAPTSIVAALPLTMKTASFTVSWSGADAAGSGIASYNVFVATDGGPFVPFQTATTATSATFVGAFGHTYGFFSVATDNVGNVEATPLAAQATTVTTRPSPSLLAVAGSGTYASTATLTATLTVGGTPLAGKTVAFALNNGATLTSVGSATTDANGIATLPSVNLAGLHAGTALGAVGVSFAGDSTDAASSATGNLDISASMATVIWANPTDIVVGTPLGAAQLDATALVPGTFTYTPAAGTVLNAGPRQTLTVTFTPNDTVDYRVVVARVLVNVAPRPVPPVTVLGVQWQTHKVTRKKAVKLLVVSYSGALDPGHAQDLGDYHLVTAGRDKKFGNRDDKRVALASATYDPATHTVKLLPRGKVSNQKLQLSITAAGTLDAQHRPIDGNRDGQPGGDFRAIFGTGGVRLASVLQSGTSGTVSPEAFDTLLVAGHLASARPLRPAARFGTRPAP